MRAKDHHWNCPCGWSGTSSELAITDASDTIEVDGVVVVDRKHLAVCPRCFDVLANPVSELDEADARGDWEYHCRRDDEGPPEAA